MDRRLPNTARIRGLGDGLARVPWAHAHGYLLPPAFAGWEPMDRRLPCKPCGGRIHETRVNLRRTARSAGSQRWQRRTEKITRRNGSGRRSTPIVRHKPSKSPRKALEEGDSV
jgi:hypothetical protein